MPLGVYTTERDYEMYAEVNVLGELHQAARNTVVVIVTHKGETPKNIWRDGNGHALSRGEAFVLYERLRGDSVLCVSSLVTKYAPDNA